MSVRRIFGVAAATVALVAALVGAAPAAPVGASGPSVVVYDSIPSPQPPSTPSQAFQAQQTAEFGDEIGLASTERSLTHVSVLMVTWAPKVQWPTYPAAGWTFPITLNKECHGIID